MPYEDSGLTLGLKPVVRRRTWIIGYSLIVVRNPAGRSPLQGVALEPACPQAGRFPGDVEALKVYAVPGCDEVFLRIRTSVAFDQDAELRVSAKNKWFHCGVIAGRRPLKMYF